MKGMKVFNVENFQDWSVKIFISLPGSPLGDIHKYTYSNLCILLYTYSNLFNPHFSTMRKVLSQTPFSDEKIQPMHLFKIPQLDFPSGPVVMTLCFQCRGYSFKVWSLVGELRSHMRVCVLSCFSHVWLFVTPRTVVCQAFLSMGFSRQGYWSGLPCPPPEDLSDPGVKPLFPVSPVSQAESL